MSDSEQTSRPSPPRMREGWIVKGEKKQTSSASASSSSSRKSPRVNGRTPLLFRHFGRPKNIDWYLFVFELRTLVVAGTPFIEGVRLLERTSERERVKRTAGIMAKLLDRGTSFKSALESATDLPPMIRSMLTMGQSTGTLVRMLDATIDHYAWLIELRSRILRLVSYPLILVVLGGMIMAARDAILAGMGGGSGSDLAHIVFLRYLLPIAACCVCGFVAGRLANVTWARNVIDFVFLHLPFVGTLTRKFALTVFFNTFAAALDSGMPVTRAYELAVKATTNRTVSARLAAWDRFLRDGESIASTLRMTGVVDKEALGMIAVGEMSSTPSSLMRKLAKWYDDWIRTVLKMVISILAPFYVLAVALGYFMNLQFLLMLGFVCCFLLALV